MLKDRRPFYIKRFQYRFQKLYVEHFIRPQFDSLGEGYFFVKPWHLRIFGSPIKIGNYVHIICASDKKVRFSIWPAGRGEGRIEMGNYSLISPGVRIQSASKVIIGDNCMLAEGVYVTDADWHGIYNRILAVGNTAAVKLKDNVWVGVNATICKGVTIGENSVIGAGSVVTTDIPDNVIAAGNPAKVVKALDPDKKITTRANLFSDPDKLIKSMYDFDKVYLRKNTALGWLRSIFFPKPGD